MEHHIKIQQEFADAIISGEKTFEIRINDRGYQKGDLIRFQVMDGYITNTSHALNDRTYEITYVLSGWGLCEGYVGLAIKKKGKWLNKGRRICCSECGRINFCKPNFCDECGADMREEKNDG